jgi:hypothetical protein
LLPLTVKLGDVETKAQICEAHRDLIAGGNAAGDYSIGFRRVQGEWGAPSVLPVAPPCTDPDCLKRPHGRGDIGCVSDTFWDRR